MNASAAVSADPAFGVRVFAPDDVPFVMDSWLMSERDSVGHQEGPYFVRLQKAMQRAILARPSTQVLIAYPHGDPETIVGWAVFSPTTLYYVFTRFHNRRFGVARLLLASLLDKPTVVYAARLGRVFDESSRAWLPSPIAARIPAGWRFLYRSNFIEV